MNKACGDWMPNFTRHVFCDQRSIKIVAVHSVLLVICLANAALRCQAAQYHAIWLAFHEHQACNSLRLQVLTMSAEFLAAGYLDWLANLRSQAPIHIAIALSSWCVIPSDWGLVLLVHELVSIQFVCGILSVGVPGGFGHVSTNAFHDGLNTWLEWTKKQWA